MRSLAVTVVAAALVACACSGADERDDGDTASGVPVTTDVTSEATSTVVSDDTTASTGSESTVATSIAPDSPSTTGGVPSSSAVRPEGYDLVAAEITAADGEVCELCLWMADTGDLRSQGLMGVTDLGDGDGMAFVYDEPHTGSFWMKNTVMPLTIAFFDPAGGYLDRFDMEPCTADPCDTYPTAENFTVAVEFEQGTADEYLVSDGATLTLLDTPCELD